MKKTLSATYLAVALALPGAAAAQDAQAPMHGAPAPMAQDGMMSEALREEMRQMMRSMMQDMMREMMAGGMNGTPQPSAPSAHQGEDHAHGGGAGTGSAATEAYRAANLAMHAAMDIEFSDDADIDFARGMIGHHQGAIDMARIVLEHGEDPDLRQLAEEIIAAQEAEIAFLRDWLAARDE